MTAHLNKSDISSEDWPSSGLETISSCPVCQSEQRRLLHDGVWDNTFFAAPGRWTLWRCGGCRSAYLNPRPDQATIGRAYQHYYTHSGSDAAPPTGLVARTRAALGNGYRNLTYGADLRPSSKVGWLLGKVVPRLRRTIDMEYRFLPRRARDQRPKVLDVGCGGGDWLLVPKRAGWDVAGSDPDPRARERAAQLGIEVRSGGAEVWSDQRGSFDAVTLSHVIEHVHDPMDTLRTIHDLLRPGGRLFIETPNIDALGHEMYGSDWRGIEAPRHLVLFNHHSLALALRSAGFVNVRERRRPNPFFGLNVLSARMRAGLDPYDDAAGADIPGPAGLMRARSAVSRKRSELLTVTCERPRARRT